MAGVNRAFRRELARVVGHSELPDRVGSAFVGLGGLGLIGTVSVPSLAFGAVRTAARIVIATAASAHLHAAHAGGAFHVGVVVGRAVGAPAWPEPAIATFAWLVAMLRAELRLRRHDDAVVVLGVLEIALRRDHNAGRESVAGERHVFLGDMRRGSADFDIRAVRFVVPCQWILGLAATAAAPAILLSLPHRLLLQP